MGQAEGSSQQGSKRTRGLQHTLRGKCCTNTVTWEGGGVWEGPEGAGFGRCHCQWQCGALWNRLALTSTTSAGVANTREWLAPCMQVKTRHSSKPSLTWGTTGSTHELLTTRCNTVHATSRPLATLRKKNKEEERGAGTQGIPFRSPHWHRWRSNMECHTYNVQ